jgi:hypothetical protein
MAWLATWIAGFPLYHYSILAFRWGSFLRPSPYGMGLLVRLRGDWRAGSGCICLRVAGLP